MLFNLTKYSDYLINYLDFTTFNQSMSTNLTLFLLIPECSNQLQKKRSFYRLHRQII